MQLAATFMKMMILSAQRVLHRARWTAIAAVLALVASNPGSLSAQSIRPCAPYDSTAAALSRLAVTILSDTSAGARRLREDHGIAAGTAADVAVVQDSTVCEVVTASMEATGMPHQSDAFIVVRLGQAPVFYLASPGGALRMRGIYLLNNGFVELTAFGP
jgi:hypothetical protein